MEDFCVVKSNDNCGCNVKNGRSFECGCKCCGYGLDSKVMNRFNQLKLAINQSKASVAILDKDFAPIWVSDALMHDFESNVRADQKFAFREYIQDFADQASFESCVAILKAKGFWSGVVRIGNNSKSTNLYIRTVECDALNLETEILIVVDSTLKASALLSDGDGVVKTLAQLQEDVKALSLLLSFNTNIHLVILTIRNISDIAFIRGEDHVNLIFQEYVKLISPKFSPKVKFYRVSDFELGLVIETSLDAREVHLRLKHFLTLVESKLEVDSFTYHLKVHAGVSTLNPNQSVDALIRNATFAKDVAENDNTPVEAYSSDDVTKHIEDYNLFERFQEALFSDKLHMEYQPIVSANQSIWGFEALVRWTDKTYGNISALKIIEFAERRGSIIRLGYWIIRRVFKDIQIIDSMTSSTKYVSINLSLEQFDDPNFAKSVYDLSIEYAVSPSRIMFEITESHSFTDLKSIVEVLNNLRDYGFLIALDDFGVGYSTMTNLVELPMNVVKLDKSLIANINDKKNSLLVCQSVVSLAHQLCFKVIAEGIEDDVDESLIKKLEVDLYQGFYYYRPLVVKKLIEVIKESECLKT